MTSGTSAPDDTPFAGLTPEAVLDALDGVGLRGDGRLIQLNSYENRVFQVFLEDGRVVVAKFYRPGRWRDAQILEEHTFAAELAAAEVPLAAPLALSVDAASLHAGHVRAIGPTLAGFGASQRFAVAPRQAGRAPELEDREVLEWIGRFIGRLHNVGAAGRFTQRLAMTPQAFGHEPRAWLLASGLVPPESAPAWGSVTAQALVMIDAAFARAGDVPRLRLHGDCHPGNLLWTGSGPHFVDLDDALTGPAVQDLWMLLSGAPSEMAAELRAVLAGYEQFRVFDRRELALIEPLRTLRMVHHSAWIARRWNDPAFPAAFGFFASPSYWDEQTRRLREQLDAMAEPPLEHV